MSRLGSSSAAISPGSEARGRDHQCIHCAGDCAPFLDAARFAGGILRFPDTREMPEAASTLHDDARGALVQIRVLEALPGAVAAAFRLGTPEGDVRLKRLESRFRDHGPAAPGGAALANIAVLIRTGQELVRMARATGIEYRNLVVPPDRMLPIAFQLAEASLDDPRNTDVLHNLAVLFRAGGDEARARLATRLAER